MRTMFALHREAWSSATRFVFRIVAMVIITLTCAFVCQPSKAQVRIGIGVGGIGGILLDDALRRQQSQNADSETTKRTAKTRNQKHRKEKRKTARRSPPNDESPSEKPPIAKPSPTTSLTASAPTTVGPPPATGDFGK